jgi:hypothetical protein
MHWVIMACILVSEALICYLVYYHQLVRKFPKKKNHYCEEVSDYYRLKIRLCKFVYW